MGESIGEATLRAKIWTVVVIIFAMTFPTLAAWSYFLGLAETGGSVNIRQQAAYVAGKIIQFSFPLVFVALAERRWPMLTRPRFDELLPGMVFSLVVASLMLGIYLGVLRGSLLLAQTPARLRLKLQEVGMATPARYFLLAVFLAAAHSLLEEYYWRWFVFGRLRQLTSRMPALALSSLAFMAHHVIVLNVYLPGKFLTTALPCSLGVAVGGAVWAWLYERSGSLWSPWVSHLLIDAAIFVIGWDLLWPLRLT
jgi:membrane protease YdiL (CAAX protease family)